MLSSNERAGIQSLVKYRASSSECVVTYSVPHKTQL